MPIDGRTNLDKYIDAIEIKGNPDRRRAFRRWRNIPTESCSVSFV